MTDVQKNAEYIKRDHIDTYHRRKIDEPSMYEILAWGDSGESFTGNLKSGKIDRPVLSDRWVTEKMSNYDNIDSSVTVQSSPKRFKSPHITVSKEKVYDQI